MGLQKAEAQGTPEGSLGLSEMGTARDSSMDLSGPSSHGAPSTQRHPNDSPSPSSLSVNLAE